MYIFSDGALLEYEAHRRGRIYLRRLSGSECSAIASEVLLGSNKFNDSSPSSDGSTGKTGGKKGKKETSYLNGWVIIIFYHSIKPLAHI